MNTIFIYIENWICLYILIFLCPYVHRLVCGRHRETEILRLFKPTKNHDIHTKKICSRWWCMHLYTSMMRLKNKSKHSNDSGMIICETWKISMSPWNKYKIDVDSSTVTGGKRLPCYESTKDTIYILISNIMSD